MSRLIFFVLTCWILGVVKSDDGNETEITRKPKILNENFDVIKDLFDKGFVRYPLAVVLDLSSESLDKVKNLWGKYENNLPDREIVLTTFDATGLRRTMSCKNNAEFFGILKSLLPSYNDNASVEKIDTFTPVMEAVLDALQKIPLDSAVLVMTGNKPKDQELGSLVEEALIRRRCRMYVIWTGEKKSNNNFILREISEHVGGKLTAITDIETANIRSKPNQEIQYKQIVIGKKTEIAGYSQVDFIVNDTYSQVNVKVEGRVSSATLKNPKGELINMKLRDDQYVLQYTIKPEAGNLGLWILETDQGSFGEMYDVVVLAEIPVFIIQGYNPYENNTEFSSPVLKGESSVLENEENPARVRFPEDQTTETLKKNNVSIHATAAQQKTLSQFSVPLIVEVSSGSTLDARPQTNLQVNFDVKNNNYLPIAVSFSARPENVIITNIQPPQTLLGPGETRVVQISVINLPNAPSGIGKITLLANGANRVTARTAMIYYTQTSLSDTWDPKIKYKYQGDCRNYDEPKTCENGQWSFEATVQDEDSGLLKVSSVPFGLLFNQEFVAGTRSPVHVTFTASCCQEKVDIFAEDLRGNYVRRSLDVFHQGLLAGEISAVVVGVILLIVIIIIIVVAIILFRRRNRSKIELPRHRAGSR